MNTVKNYHNGHGMGDISRAGTGSQEEVAVLAAGAATGAAARAMSRVCWQFGGGRINGLFGFLLRVWVARGVEGFMRCGVKGYFRGWIEEEKFR